MIFLRFAMWMLVTLIVMVAIGLFGFAPGIIERQRNQVLDLPALEVSQDTQTVHDRLFIADLHADSLLWKRDLARPSSRGHADIPRLIRGGTELQVFSAVTKSPAGQNYEHNTGDSDTLLALAMVQLQPPDTWRSPFARARFQARKLERAAVRNGRLRVIRTRTDLAAVDAARADGERLLGGLLALEGLHALEGEAEHLAVLWEDGYRMAGLHHFFDNALGGSLHGVSQGGLSEFGRQVVRDMNEAGWIIDVAHSSPAVVEEVLALSTTPLVVSHTGFKGHCDRTRNIADDLMLAIAEAGGLIGQGYWDEATCDPSPAGIAKSIRYGIELVGEDHIALGSDFDGAVATPFDATGLNQLTQALRDEGLTADQIAKVMGENARRFFADNLPDSAP